LKLWWKQELKKQRTFKNNLLNSKHMKNDDDDDETIDKELERVQQKIQ
jgi:hypothetical protein